MSRETEDATERDRRRYQRKLFDGVARLYAATRPGYPPELAGFVAATAGAGPGAAVLEVGCGTGQLTERLAPLGFALTAIDVGVSMIEVARERITAGNVTFGVENTRATSLSWPDEVRQAFTEELRRRLSGQAEVGLTLAARVTMARVRRPASGG